MIFDRLDILLVIGKILHRFYGAIIFSKFDIKSDFWKIQIDPKDHYKIIVNVPFGKYEWNVMPFELKNTLHNSRNNESYL